MFFTKPSRKVLKQGCEETLADKKQIAFGLFDNDMMVGFAEISERSIGDGKQIAPCAYLEVIYVAKQYRQNGLAKKLIRKAQKWAKKRGLKVFASDAKIENKTSILAHASWGFEEDKRIVIFKKKL
ncbi:MAG: GNAT family N-acetyltransferase [Devosiaceae bacterium]|nr:GNAT family N-acetyltransferase [Devosiaceae bacterium]